MTNHPESDWEQRWHPLLREWVVYSAHRQQRPWTGEQAGAVDTDRPPFDPDCYLCPRNERVGGRQNPDYDGVFVFNNDRPSISPDAPGNLATPPGIYQNRPATGIARVICYSPRHDLTMSELSHSHIERIVSEWQCQTAELSGIKDVRSVSIFENKGEVCGMSNSHPHGQIYATNYVSKTIERYLEATQLYRQEYDRSLFNDIVETEIKDGRRIIGRNESFIAFIPYFARFPYEINLMPTCPIAHITALNDEQSIRLAALLKEVLVRLDNLWRMPFPYHLMVHQAPFDGGGYEDFTFHLALYPPMRTPLLRKFVAAYELGSGNFLSDTMPEQKAAELQGVATTHYKIQ